jgi:hypothetical protein
MKKYTRLLFMSLVVAFLSTVAIHGIPVFFAGAQSAPPGSALPPNCAPAQIDKVGASGYDLEGDNTTPDKTIDKNVNTRWANYGVGSFIQYELKTSDPISGDTICGIDISWYRGDVRTYNFIVSTSQDGIKFDNAFFATSSGKTTSLERYIIPDSALKAKHVRITVNGNTENQWAGITEVQVLSQSASLPVTPITPPPPPASECPCPPVTPVVSTNPPNVATGVSASANVVATFGKAMNPSTLTTSTFTLVPTSGGAPVPAIVSMNSPTNTVATLNPSADLTPGASYTARIAGSVTDAAGAPMAADKVWTFSVANTPPNPPSPPTSECPCPPVTPVNPPPVTPVNPPPVTPVNPPPVTPVNPPPSKDVFGVTKIYADKPNGEKWFMNMADPNNDPRYDPKTALKKNPDGSWKVTDSQVRMNVFTSTGYDESKIQTYDQSELATKGYMQAPNDWKNIELTGYVKINSASDSDFHFTWYGRGGHHSDIPCEGTAYKGSIYKDGSSRFSKEQWHSGGYSFTPTTNVLKSSIVGKWIGYKVMIYNTVVDGKDAVKLENWVDINANDVWTKIYGYTDSAGLGGDGTECGGTPDQLISWGGPIADFRWDGTSNIDVKNLSVREISPP